MMRSLCSARGMNDVRRHPTAFGVVPPHQRFEADDLAGREIGDRLIVHHEVAGVEGVTQLLDQRESAHRALVHGGREDHVVTADVALRLVERGVHVLDRLGEAVARGVPDHDADAGALFDLESGDVVGLGDDADQSFGEDLGLARRDQTFGQVEELVAAEATQRVGRARDRVRVDWRSPSSNWSPTKWPWVSLTPLKSSRSIKSTAPMPP